MLSYGRISFLSTVRTTYRRGEIIADAAVHAIGVCVALPGAYLLLTTAAARGDAVLLASVTLYAGGLLAMLVCSGLYNALGACDGALRRLDHAAIFLLIAGTYAPLSLLAIGGQEGRVLFALVGGTAVFGTLIKLARPERLERLSLPLYLVLGWAVLPLVQPLSRTLSEPSFDLLIAGGLVYTAGIVFHLWERLPYHKAIWHLFVLVGAACHYKVVLELVRG